jgi:hypothetical protein
VGTVIEVRVADGSHEADGAPRVTDGLVDGLPVPLVSVARALSERKVALEPSTGDGATNASEPTVAREEAFADVLLCLFRDARRLVDDGPIQFLACEGVRILGALGLDIAAAEELDDALAL